MRAQEKALEKFSFVQIFARRDGRLWKIVFQASRSWAVDGVEELKIEISKSSPHSRFTMRKLLLDERGRKIELKVFFNRRKSFKKKLVFVYF